jgi:hypothetical protein
MAVKLGDLVVIGKYEGIARVKEIQSYERDINKSKFRFIVISYLYDISPSGMLIQCCQDYQVKKIGKKYEDKIKDKFKRLHNIDINEDEKSINQIESDFYLLKYMDIPKNVINFKKYLVVK